MTVRCLILLNRSAGLLDPGMLVNIQQPLIRDDGTVLLAADSKVLFFQLSFEHIYLFVQIILAMYIDTNNSCSWEDKVGVSLTICTNGGNKLINRNMISFHGRISAKGQPQVVPHMVCQLGLGLMVTRGFKDHCEPLFFL